MPAKRLHDYQGSVVERRPDALVADCDRPGLMAAPHWHAQAEVNYVVRGWLRYEMQGYEVRFEAGEVALFWGGLPHRLADTSEDSLYHVYHLPLPHVFRLRLGTDLQRRVMGGATLIAGQVQDEDAAAFARWRRYLDTGEAKLMAHVVGELLMRLERLGFEPHRLVEAGSEATAEAPRGPSGRAVRRICSFVAENFRDAIDAAAIARAAGLHPKYAMTLFRGATGLTLGQYLTLLRVSYAQALLVEGHMSILDVAMASGFGSLSTFNYRFRQRAGMTPSEFQREHRPKDR